MQNTVTEPVVRIQNVLIEQDFSLKELPHTIIHLLQTAHLPWLNSLQFCTGYPHDPAERVFIRGDSEKIHQAVFYRLIKRFGFLRIIEVIGFPDIEDKAIQSLIKTHHAQLAVVNRMELPVKPDEQWRPTQAHVYAKTYIPIIELPATKEEYLKQLGKKKRERYPNYWRRLNRHFNPDGSDSNKSGANRAIGSGIEIECRTAHEIKLEDVILLECLNRDRRSGKGKGVDSIHDIEARQKHKFPLTTASGYMVTIKNNGKVLGGTLSFICRDEAYLAIIAHDPAHEHLNVGTLVLWKTIEQLIDKGITQFNLLWGRQPYKTQFLGVEYPWSIHIISPYQWLAVIWKIQVAVNEFYIRGWRFLKTRLGLS